MIDEIEALKGPDICKRCKGTGYCFNLPSNTWWERMICHSCKGTGYDPSSDYVPPTEYYLSGKQIPILKREGGI